MKNLTLTICLTLAVLFGSAGTSWGADFQKGLAAYDSGDLATALREWKPLAEQGNADAQHNLGLMYREGQGVPKDDKTAVKWWTFAAEQKDPTAQAGLGMMYQAGKGVIQDHKIAFKWYILAAEQGNASAQFGLGLMYMSGKGVPQNDVYALMWWDIATSNGFQNVGKIRDQVAKEMTPSQIDEAEILARECVRKKYKGC